MKYAEAVKILEDGAKSLIKEEIDNGKTYSQAVVAVKKKLVKAIEEAYHEKEYHLTNAAAWGEGDGDAGLRKEYGTYENMIAQKKNAEKTMSGLQKLKVDVQKDYSDKCLETIHDFPKRGPREDNADYSMRLDAYVANATEFQEEAKKVIHWLELLSKTQEQGYDSDSRSSYNEYNDTIDRCIDKLEKLPYVKLEDAKEVLQEATKGIEKAKEKKAELQGAFGG